MKTASDSREGRPVPVRKIAVVAAVAAAASLAALPFLAWPPLERYGWARGLLALLALAEAVLCWRLWSARPRRPAPVVRGLVACCRRPWLAALAALALVEAGLVLAQNVHLLHLGRPALSLSLALVHVACGLAFIAICNWGGIDRWLESPKPTLTGVTLTLAFFALCGLLAEGNAHPAVSGAVDSLLRRPLQRHESMVVSDAKLDAVEFWSEFNHLRQSDNSRWLPYTYFRMAPFAGKYHNISAAGLRRTKPAPANGRSVFVFGGSTAWGFGARDEFTIPSHLVDLLAGAGPGAQVVNFGELGYVSTQDLILFMRQLQLGRVPSVAVFYQGLNEVYGAYSSGYAGVPARETNRVKEFNMGRLFFRRAKGNVGRLVPANFVNLVPNPPLENRTVRAAFPDLNLDLVAGDCSAERIVDLYLANVRAARLLCRDYGVRPVFVWQPVPWLYKDLTPHERKAVAEYEASFPGSRRLFEDSVRELERRLAAEPSADFLYLARLFEGVGETVYIDAGHITEAGNLMVAREIAPPVAAALAAAAGVGFDTHTGRADRAGALAER